jgi:hypothetical protein
MHGPVGIARSIVPRDESQQERQQAPEDRSDEPGAEGGTESPAADRVPGAPADDDSPLGDTDQHSKG